MSGRIFVLGDIHGNLKALDQCLERSAFVNDSDTLIQLGDLCDRYPDTAMVIETLLSIKNLIAIRGNHDPWLSHWLSHKAMQPGWAENGGVPTVQSYRQASEDVDRSKHLNFLKQQQLDYYIDAKNRVFVHAGFTHPKGPKFEQLPSNCYWDRSLWTESREALRINQPLERAEQFKEIYIGHTPTINWRQDVPMQAFNVWNLDTGAGWTGRLTIMDVDSKEYWQSDRASELY